MLICNKTNILLYDHEYLQIYIEVDIYKKSSIEGFYIDIIDIGDNSLSLFLIIIIVSSGGIVIFGGITILCYQFKKYVLDRRLIRNI